MSINLLITQLPYVEQMAQTQVGHPEAMQALAQEQAAEQVKRDREQVPKADPEDPAHGVNEDGGGAGRQETSARHPQHGPPPEEPAESEPQPNPWAGNIVNVKI